MSATALRSFLILTVALGAAAGVQRPLRAGELPSVEFNESPGQFAILIGGRPFATYVYDDKTISRPYFAHIHAPGGAQVTRNHPPVEGRDLTDHATFHPGVWMAFGDISGSDYWRLAAPVKNAGFVDKPAGGPGRGHFAVRNSYRNQQDPAQEVCREECRFDVRVVAAGYLLLWDSTFSSDNEFYFGDQEEMGLGFRIATPLRAEKSTEGGLPAGAGTIMDSHGRRNEEKIWGNSAEWCDYSGVIDGQRVGMALFCHPKNFRPSWFHARDYGLLEANPFGRAAFGKGEPSKIPIKPGESLRLRYGVLVHAGADSEAPIIEKAYKSYLDLTNADSRK